MKRFCLMIAVLAVVAMGVIASTAVAYTKGQAEGVANPYALANYFQAEDGSCTSSGKNVKGEAQWYCSGQIDHGFGGSWHVNVGPYGEITYAEG